MDIENQSIEGSPTRRGRRWLMGGAALAMCWLVFRADNSGVSTPPDGVRDEPSPAPSTDTSSSGGLETDRINGVPAGSVFLLVNDIVRDEIELTDSQFDQMDRLIANYYRRYREIDSLTGDEKDAEQGDAADIVRTRRSQLKARLKSDGYAVLSPAQQVRLEQIDARLRGLNLFFDGEFVRQLRLSRDQIVGIQKIVRRHRSERHAERAGPGEREDIREQILALFDQRQRSIHDEWVGEKLTFDRQDIVMGIRVSEGLRKDEVTELERRFLALGDDSDSTVELSN